MRSTFRLSKHFESCRQGDWVKAKQHLPKKPDEKLAIGGVVLREKRHVHRVIVVDDSGDGQHNPDELPVLCQAGSRRC